MFKATVLCGIRQKGGCLVAIPAFAYIRKQQSDEPWLDERRRMVEEMYLIAVAQREQAAEMFTNAQLMTAGAKLMRDNMR